MRLDAHEKSKEFLAAATLLFALAIGASARPAPPQNHQRPEDRARPYVVAVRAYDKAGRVMATGWGVVVSAGRYIFTASHLVKGASRIDATLPGSSTAVPIKKVSNSNPNVDLVVLDGSGIARNSADHGDAQWVDAGTWVYVPVIAKDGSIDFMRAEVAREVTLGGKPYFELSQAIDPRCDGAPVLNGAGNVVGTVTTAVRGHGPNGLAIPESEIWKLWERPSLANSGTIGGVPGGIPESASGPRATPPPPPAPPSTFEKHPRPNVPYRVSGTVMAGKAITKVVAKYPDMAKAAKIEGVVVVEIVVDERGNVNSARALSGHPLLQDASLTAAKQWKFTPTKLDGEPVKVIGTLTFTFSRQ
jgi:TonB family protein